MLMCHMSEKQHTANPESLPRPSPHILYLCWFQAQEVHYMMAFKVAIPVIPDTAKAVWEHNHHVSNATHTATVFWSNKAMTWQTTLKSATPVGSYEIQIFQDFSSELYQGQQFRIWRPKKCSWKSCMWEGWLNITHLLCNMRVGGE